MSTCKSSLGRINPYHPPDGFTSHIEPPEVGGKRYWKCEDCGVESIYWQENQMTSEFVHYDGCSNPVVGDCGE